MPIGPGDCYGINLGLSCMQVMSDRAIDVCIMLSACKRISSSAEMPYAG